MYIIDITIVTLIIDVIDITMHTMTYIIVMYVQYYCYIDNLIVRNCQYRNHDITFLIFIYSTCVHVDKSNGQTVVLVHLLMFCSGEYYIVRL